MAEDAVTLNDRLVVPLAAIAENAAEPLVTVMPAVGLLIVAVPAWHVTPPVFFS